MVNIFTEFFSSLTGFASSDSLFLPFLIITPMVLCVFSGIFGLIKQ